MDKEYIDKWRPEHVPTFRQMEAVGLKIKSVLGKEYYGSISVPWLKQPS